MFPHLHLIYIQSALVVPKGFDAQPYNCKDNPDMDLSKICSSLGKIRLQKHCDIWFSVIYAVLRNTGDIFYQITHE